MSADTIELTVSAAKGLIPCLRGDIEALGLEIQRLQASRDEKARALTELIAKLEKQEAQAANSGKTKRLRKGEAEKIIVDLLRRIPSGERGLSVQQVSEQSGVPYASAFRVLTTNKKGQFDNPEGFWILHKR